MSDLANCKFFEELMARSRCYLDYNATAPLRDDALQACVSVLQETGNASSVHAEGRGARRAVEQARRAVAALVGASSDRVIFTSGATEGANLALSPDLRGATAPGGTQRLLVAATEHPAVLCGHRFNMDRVTILPVDGHGRIDLDALALTLAADNGCPALLAVQAANNETGVLQPVTEAAAMVHARGGLLVCDAVQVVGRVPFDIGASGADVVLVSSHKLGGPHGAGAVVLAAGVSIGSPHIKGGGQERGFRSGTENVAGIAGFGAAARLVGENDESKRLLALRERLESRLLELNPETVIFGVGVPRLPNTTCFAVPGFSAETLLMALDIDGFAISSGSACSSGKVAASHVLFAMGIDPRLIRGALRVSSGFGTRKADLDRFVEALQTVMHRMQVRCVAAAA